MINSNRARIVKEAIIANEKDGSSNNIDDLTLECVIAAYYLTQEYFNSKHSSFQPIDLDDNQLAQTGIQSEIIELISQVGIKISSQNTLISITQCIDDVGNDSINHFLNHTGDTSPMFLDISIQLIAKLNWHLRIPSDQLKTISKKQDNIMYNFSVPDILRFWKQGALYECINYYNQSVRAITNLDLRVNSLIVETYRDMLDNFSVSQIQKTTFNSCNFALRIIIEKRIGLEEFNNLFVKYYVGYFRKARLEGWEQNIKGFDYRFTFLKASRVTEILFRRILKIEVDSYQLPINENSLVYLTSAKSNSIQ